MHTQCLTIRGISDKGGLQRARRYTLPPAAGGLERPIRTQYAKQPYDGVCVIPNACQNYEPEYKWALGNLFTKSRGAGYKHRSVGLSANPIVRSRLLS